MPLTVKPMRLLCSAVIACFFLGATHAISASTELTPQQRELVRQQKVQRAFVGKGLSPRELCRAINEPVIRGNQAMVETNQEYADRFHSKAKEYGDKGDEESFKQYNKLGDLFAEYVAQNKAILGVFTGKGGVLSEAFAEVKRIEGEIFKITRKRVKRDWFLPEELAATPSPFAQR